MRLAKLKEVLNGAQTSNFSDVEIKGVTSDSRRVKKDFLFAAIRGYALDGHGYVADAVRNGAAALLVERQVDAPSNVPQIVVADTRRALAVVGSRFYGDPSTRMKVVGVTGTNGKTTTTHLVKSILDASGRECGLIGTVGYKVGNRNVPSSMTTPDAVDMQSLLAEMLEEKIAHAAVEVSSHALSQARVDKVRFACAVFTNLTRDHLDYHKTMENYLAVKGLLFEGLGSDAAAVLNADDPASKEFAARTKARVVRYGIREVAEFTARGEEVSIAGMSFDLDSPLGVVRIESSLIGRHNIYNILAAAAACYSLGVDMPFIKVGVEAIQCVPGRLDPVKHGQKYHVLVDYAHTPDALESVLTTLRGLAPKRLIVVFGCGGDRDRTKRPIMGGIAERIADLCWVTSDNPRSERPAAIIEEILAGVKRREAMRVQPERSLAIAEAIREAREGDIVLIAGKGHERYQILSDTVIPFDDKDEARKAIEAAAGS